LGKVLPGPGGKTLGLGSDQGGGTKKEEGGTLVLKRNEKKHKRGEYQYEANRGEGVGSFIKMTNTRARIHDANTTKNGGAIVCHDETQSRVEEENQDGKLKKKWQP